MVFYWLFSGYNELGIDPFAKGYLNATSTPMRTDYKPGQWDIKNIIFWNNKGIYTTNVVNASFELHFLKKSFSFIKYKLKSMGGSCCSARGLLLECSMNGKDYKTVNYDTNYICDSTHCSQSVDKSFTVSKSKCRYVKMTQVLGECENGAGVASYFGLNGIDFYVQDLTNNCSPKNFRALSNTFMFMIVLMS